MTPLNIAHQATLSMGLLQARMLPCPPPGDLPNPGIKLRSPALQVDSLPSKPSYSFFVNKLCVFEKSVYLAVVGCNVVVLLVRSRCSGVVQIIFIFALNC